MTLDKLHAAALAFGLCVLSSCAVAQSIRPFKAEVQQAALDELRRRIADTRWPDKETVADGTQGAQLAKLQELVRYWGSGYDWRKAEAKLNALPQFVTTIDGVDIHFIHVRSRHDNALPVIVTQVVSGHLNKQVASDLGISEVTVKFHRGRTMRKMKARSLAALVNMAANLRSTS